MNHTKTVRLVGQYQNGDNATQSKASNKLWQLYHDWVETIVGAHARFRKGADRIEMLSEACLAFMTALAHYDLSKADECSLKTYSAFWINGALINYKKVQIHNGYIVPRCLATVRSALFIASTDRNSISEDSLQTIAGTYGIPIKRVKELEMFFCNSENLSFDQWQKDYESTYENEPVSNIHSIDRLKTISHIYSFVKKQNFPIATVLYSRWLTDKKTPLKILAKKLGQSYESIRQIEMRAFDSLMIELKQLAII